MDRWAHLTVVPIPSVNSNNVHFIIGQDALSLIRAEEYYVGGDNDTYTTRTVLGWVISTLIINKDGMSGSIFSIQISLQTRVEKF